MSLQWSMWSSRWFAARPPSIGEPADTFWPDTQSEQLLPAHSWMLAHRPGRVSGSLLTSVNGTAAQNTLPASDLWSSSSLSMWGERSSINCLTAAQLDTRPSRTSWEHGWALLKDLTHRSHTVTLSLLFISSPPFFHVFLQLLFLYLPVKVENQAACALQLPSNILACVWRPALVLCLANRHRPSQFFNNEKGDPLGFSDTKQSVLGLHM